MKQVAGKLRLDMAQFRELAAFAQFGSDLDKSTQSQLDRGQHLQEILKQAQYEPMSLGQQVAVLFAAVNGLTDSIALEKMRDWEEGFHRYLAAVNAALLETIEREKRISPESEAALKNAVSTYNASWQ
jgi:F-type H+-transporting ATPase subunit alpha